MRKRLSVILIICLLTLSVGGCARLSVNTESICDIVFDYSDEGINDVNAKAMLEYYCLCNPKDSNCSDLSA